MDSKLNFEGTELIDIKRKRDSEPIERKTVEEIEAERQKEIDQIRIGESFLWGNRSINPNEPVEDENYRHVAFESEDVQKKIKKDISTNLSLYMEQDVSIVEVTNTTIHKKEGYESEQNKRLTELASKYSDTSLKKRKAALKTATKYFAQIDKKKKKLLKEKDPYKQLALKLEIVDLKAKALSERARANGRDIGAINDELANITIAANYEKIELYNRRINKGDADEEGGEGLITQDHQKLLLQLTEKADKNIDKIAEQRRRHRGLEIFDAAFKKRMEERKDRDEKGRIKADVKRNEKRAALCKEAFKKSGFGGETDKIKDIDKVEEKEKKKKSYSKALTIQNSLSSFTSELTRSIDSMEKGEIVSFTTRSLLSLQYDSLLKMCDNYLDSYKNNEKSENKTEKTCFDYVKTLKDRLIEGTGKKASFSTRFSVIFREFINYKARTPFNKGDVKKEETRVVDISKAVRKGLGEFLGDT